MSDVEKYAQGGFVPGGGNPYSDSLKIRLHGCTVHPKPHPKALIRNSDGQIECDGELVIRASAVRSISRDALDRINRGEGE